MSGEMLTENLEVTINIYDEKLSGINLKKSTPSNFKLEESIIEMRGICTSCSSAELT